MVDRAEWRCTLRSIARFYAIAVGLSWIMWLPLVLGPEGFKITRWDPPFPEALFPGTLGPILGCFIAHRMETGDWRAVRLLPHGKVRWVWLLVGPALVLFTVFFVFPALVTKGGPAAWHWHPGMLVGIPALMLKPYNLLGGPVFEEFGWRGYLQPKLESIMAPWIAAICVGSMWALWHLPLFFIPWSSASPRQFLLILIGLSIVMAFGSNGSGRVVTVAILMHLAFNVSSLLLGGFLGNVELRTTPAPDDFIAIAFLLVGAILALATRGRLLSSNGKMVSS